MEHGIAIMSLLMVMAQQISPQLHTRQRNNNRTAPMETKILGTKSMKTAFSILFLIAGCAFAFATSQTTLNQDKPPRLYVKKYSEYHNEFANQNGTVVYLFQTGSGPFGASYSQGTDVFNNVYSYIDTIKYKDNVSGSLSQNYHEQDTSYTLSTGSTIDDSVSLPFTQYLWPNVSGSENELIYRGGYYGSTTNSYTTTNATPVQYASIPNEHCNLNLSGTLFYVPNGPRDLGGLVTTAQSVIRSAQTVYKLQTGGKAASKNKNLFGLSATASQINYQMGYAIWWGSLYPTTYQGWNVTSNTPISATNITFNGYGSQPKNGVLYVTLSDNDDVDITPTVQNVDYYTFNVGQTKVQTKSDWQKVVQYEIDNDSGVKIENYAASSGFLTNRPNIKAVYSFYQKVFVEQPTWYYWAGLAKLAGAPVYAGLSDAEYGRNNYITTGFLTLGLGGASIAAVLPYESGQFQTNLIGMNIAVYNDVAWQFEAYRKVGLNALETANTIDPSVLDIGTWRIIDQGIKQNNITNIQAGNQLILQREQQQTLTPGYGSLSSLFPGLTSLMSIMAQNPVTGGPSFSSLEPSGNIANFSDRWDWITRPYTSTANSGMLPLWLRESSTAQKQDVNQDLMSRALPYSFVYTMNSSWTLY
jgi:hypothetical protein